MQKRVIVFSIILAIVGLCLVVGLPQIANVSAADVQLDNPLGAGTNIDTLIRNFIMSVLGLSGVLALVAFIFGGIYWLISMGDTNKITKGKNIMIWAIMGLVVIFGSYAIITLVYNIIGIK